MQDLKFSSSIFVPEDGLLDPEDEGIKFFLNGSNCFPNNTVKHPRRWVRIKKKTKVTDHDLNLNI